MHSAAETTSNESTFFEAVIVGSGFSGSGAAHSLQKIGVQNFLILEKEVELGGT